MNTTKITATLGAVLLSLTAAASLAPAASAATNSTSETAIGRIVAQDPSQLLRAEPSAPRAITVHAEPGSSVTVQLTTGKGKARTKKTNDEWIATFTKLRAGRNYTVTSNGETTNVVPVIAVSAAAGLTARTTNEPTSIDLTWEHRATPARGGEAITYRVTATQIDATTGKQLPGIQPIEQTASTTNATLTDLDPRAIYEFRVTPINALGAGKASVATMTEPLATLVGASQPTAQPVTPSSAPKAERPPSTPRNLTPQPAPSPSTRTIWVCPSGFADAGSNCTKTAAYTYTTRDYTFHDETETSPYTYRTEVIGPSPILDTYETPDVCPSGYNLEDYGAQGKWCKLYGPAPTAQVKNAAPSGWTDNGTAYEQTVSVKDATPAGFTDDGNQWIKKDAAPSGWSDDGSQYVKTVAKEARVVPA